MWIQMVEMKYIAIWPWMVLSSERITEYRVLSSEHTNEIITGNWVNFVWKILVVSVYFLKK